jgi:sugar/nucleoside kinase (ribokinase family)
VKFDVLCAGSYCLDIIFTGMPAFLEPGREVFATGFEMTTGEAYNSVVCLHRLGVKVGWAADFGKDDFSQFALAATRREGLDESLFVHHDQPMRRVSVSASYPDDRAFLTYYDPQPEVPAVFKVLVSTTARVLYLPGLYSGPLLEEGLSLVRQKKMKIFMDGNGCDQACLSDPHIRQAISSVDALLPNAPEARRLTGESDLQAAVDVLAEICPLVVIKDGANGAYACQGKEVIHAPALPVDVVDTTGAGDAFNAGFLKAWLDGLTLLECLRWGNAAGGLSTTGRGGTTRVVRPADIQRAIAQQFK